DRQLETIQEFCVQSGYEIQKVYREQISGTKDESDRPKLAERVTGGRALLQRTKSLVL
ncbi:MAG: recombinase family protein, partial [Desulfobacteraceae bacterium]|nr:recombinase family protein [Desulfobacteraceae bacterium]